MFFLRYLYVKGACVSTAIDQPEGETKGHPFVSVWNAHFNSETKQQNQFNFQRHHNSDLK